MKFALIIPDGSADEPQASLGGKTPLEAARLPAMDAVAAAGVVGRANHTPATLPAGSDVANLSLLGYNPLEHFTGRAPLEAAAQGIELGPDDWAVRCNLVTIEDQADARLHRRAYLDRGSRRAAGDGASETGQRPLAVPSGRQLPQPVGASAAAGSRPPFSPDTRTTPPHDLLDQAGAGRLSARAGQRSADAVDERKRGAAGRASGERRPAPEGQAAGHQHLALGAGKRAAADALRPAATATAGR